MTEYDYSPEAYEKYMATQARIANWVNNTNAHARQYANPFVRSSSSSSSSSGPPTPAPREYRPTTRERRISNAPAQVPYRTSTRSKTVSPSRGPSTSRPGPTRSMTTPHQYPQQQQHIYAPTPVKPPPGPTYAAAYTTVPQQQTMYGPYPKPHHHAPAPVPVVYAGQPPKHTSSTSRRAQTSATTTYPYPPTAAYAHQHGHARGASVPAVQYQTYDPRSGREVRLPAPAPGQQYVVIPPRGHRAELATHSSRTRSSSRSSQSPAPISPAKSKKSQPLLKRLLTNHIGGWDRRGREQTRVETNGTSSGGFWRPARRRSY